MELIEEAKNTGTGNHEGLIDQSSECALSSTGDPQQFAVKILVPSVREAHVLEGTVECDTMTIALRFCERAVHIKDYHSKH